MKHNIKTIAILLIIVVFALFAIRIVKIALEGEEGRLKRTIYKAKRLTEREHIVALTNYISSDYSDELGNDRRSLLFIAKSFFDEYRNILIPIKELDIEIEGENASVHIEATVYWQENDSTNIIYDTAEVKAKFKKDKSGWKLIELEFLEQKNKQLFNPLIG